MDNLLTAGQSISILDQLHAKMEELGSREKVIIESRDRELKAIRRKCGLEHARLKEQAEAETQKGMEVLEEERLRLETRFDLRKARIDQAYEKAQVALQEIAEQARSQQKYKIRRSFCRLIVFTIPRCSLWTVAENLIWVSCLKRPGDWSN